MITWFFGNTGSGKTTLLKLITGYYKPEAGSVYYNGKEVSKNLR